MWDFSAPFTDAVVCSYPTVYARSPLAPAATSSKSYDVQSEKRDASHLNVPLTSTHPLFVFIAPEQRHRILRGPHRHSWRSVAIVDRCFRLHLTRDSRSEEVLELAHRRAPPCIWAFLRSAK